MKKPFIGFGTPRLEYDILKGDLPDPRKVSPERCVTLLIEKPPGNGIVLPKPGDSVATGAKIALSDEMGAYLTSTATGTISDVSTTAGDYGRSLVSVTVDIAEESSADEAFSEHSDEPGPKSAGLFLSNLPGKPPLSKLSNPAKPINRVVVCCMDQDLLVTTNQFVASANIDTLKSGMAVLREVTRTKKITVAASEALAPRLSGIDADVKTVDALYPSACPELLVKELFDEIVPAGKSCEDLGIGIISAEAVVSMAKAYETGTLPFEKTLTLIDKGGKPHLVQAPVGTPVKEILKAFDISMDDGDQLISGGPMTGSSIFSTETPVQPDMDALMVLPAEMVALSSDYPCINCGDCVRICPANISINVLVRFLEVGQYHEAADDYDLYSCVECGQCSFVCPVKIPIFQYIKLAKYELGRLRIAEENND